MELLAPAGNFDALKAAVISGADAVYLGTEKFGARASACNFDADTLRQAVEFAHLRGVKIYLTVNTLIKDNEMQEAVEIVKYAQSIGVDAFLVQDLGFTAQIRKSVPDAVLHASTQMGISNAYGAAFAKELGVVRVVVARETLPQDIAAIKHTTGLEVEMFVHGALCVAYSGNCYYSSLVSGCSGNRGRCLQLCRKRYDVNGKQGYWLSAKDICLLDKIAALQAAGVDSLKIEGRMRSVEYVAETVSVYRKALDGIVLPDAQTRLKRVFNRGEYCNAYWDNPTQKVIYAKAQNHIGVSVGKVRGVKNKKVILDAPVLSVGDGVKYMRSGCEVGGGQIDGLPATGYLGDVRVGDEVRLTSAIATKQAVEKSDCHIPVNMTVLLKRDENPQIAVTCKQATLQVIGDSLVESAVNRALTQDEVKKTIGILGDTDFSLQTLSVQMDDNIFYPASKIKELRKKIISSLREKLLQKTENVVLLQTYNLPSIRWLSIEGHKTFVQVPNVQTLSQVKFAYDYVILSPSDYSDIASIRADCEALQGKAILQLPYIVRGDDGTVLSVLRDLPIQAVVANNVGHFAMFDDIPFVGGLGLNHLNDYFVGTFIDSIEREQIGTGITYVYGKPPLMHFAHCPRKTQGGTCSDCHGYKIYIRDEKGAAYTFCRIREKHCYGALIPEVPINIVDEKNPSSHLFDLTYATRSEIDALNAQMQGKKYTLASMRGNRGRRLQ